MSCNWCESDRDIYNLCDNKDHSVCKPCYEKYIRIYSNRLRGCPYCIGVVEVVVSHQDDLLVTGTIIPREVIVSIGLFIVCCFSFMVGIGVFVVYII